MNSKSKFSAAKQAYRRAREQVRSHRVVELKAQELQAEGLQDTLE